MATKLDINNAFRSKEFPQVGEPNFITTMHNHVKAYKFQAIFLPASLCRFKQSWQRSVTDSKSSLFPFCLLCVQPLSIHLSLYRIPDTSQFLRSSSSPSHPNTLFPYNLIKEMSKSCGDFWSEETIQELLNPDQPKAASVPSCPQTSDIDAKSDSTASQKNSPKKSKHRRIPAKQRLARNKGGVLGDGEMQKIAEIEEVINQTTKEAETWPTPQPGRKDVYEGYSLHQKKLILRELRSKIDTIEFNILAAKSFLTQITRFL